MRRLIVFIGLFVLLPALAACPTGYWFQVESESPIVDGELGNTIDGLADQAAEEWYAELYPLVHSEGEPDRARRDVLTGRLVTDGTCGSLKPILSFAQISDSQLKEHSISLFWKGRGDEKIYDQFISGADRNDQLEQYDYAALLATILGVNRLTAAELGSPNSYEPCPQPRAPQFVVHTGDAVDSGMFSELYEFLSIMRRLEVPFYNVIGNHDVLFFGTFPPDAMNGHNVVIPFVPIHGARRFMLAHHPDAFLQDISVPHIDADAHSATIRGVGGTGLALPRSYYHGFDLRCSKQTGRELCSEAAGYYYFDVTLESHAEGKGTVALRFIVLNTSEILPQDKAQALDFRARGSMSDEQFQWLSEQLGDGTSKPDLVIVAGHHPFRSFYGNQGARLEILLKDEPRVLAFLAGHTHVNEIRQHDRGNGRPPLWEIIAGSTLGYPQFGLLIELLENTDNPLESYIRVRTFRQDLGDSACMTGNEVLPCRAQSARSGAEADTQDGAWRSDADAVAAANGMLLITLRHE